MTPSKRRIWCVIPTKGFERAKSRLAGQLSDAQRVHIATTMFEHVHSVCAAHPGIAGVLVATDDGGVEAVAKDLGAEVVRDAGTGGLGEVVDAALVRATDLGATHAIVVMSDLPHLSALDLDAMVEALGDRRMAIAPDRSQAGTSALAVACPAPIRTCFGRADSFEAHQHAARAAGASVVIVTRDGIAFDVDTPDDYIQWRPLATRAPR